MKVTKIDSESRTITISTEPCDPNQQDPRTSEDDQIWAGVIGKQKKFSSLEEMWAWIHAGAKDD